MYTKYEVWTLNIMQDICVKKIKVEKLDLNPSKQIFTWQLLYRYIEINPGFHLMFHLLGCIDKLLRYLGFCKSPATYCCLTLMSSSILWSSVFLSANLFSTCSSYLIWSMSSVCSSIWLILPSMLPGFCLVCIGRYWSDASDGRYYVVIICIMCILTHYWIAYWNYE